MAYESGITFLTLNSDLQKLNDTSRKQKTRRTRACVDAREGTRDEAIGQHVRIKKIL